MKAYSYSLPEQPKMFGYCPCEPKVVCEDAVHAHLEQLGHDGGIVYRPDINADTVLVSGAHKRRGDNLQPTSLERYFDDRRILSEEARYTKP